MRTALFITVVLTTAIGVWLILGVWIPSGSERFYCLLPPVALLLLAGSVKQPRRWFRTQTPRAAVFLLCLALVATAYAWFWAAAVGLPVTRLLPEIVLAIYFLAGVVLLSDAARHVLRGAGRGIGNSSFGSAPVGLLRRLGRALIADALPALLLGVLVLAYLLAVMNVHRFKIPNAATPQSALGRQYEDVTLTTGDGLTLRGWFIPARESSERTVVICHGLGANRSMFLGHVQVGDALEANVLMFDFRGHGDSDGHTCTLGHQEKLDVLAAVDYLRTQKPGQAREIIGLGISMGSAALVRAAADLEKPLDALILDSGFASALELTDSILTNFPAPVRPPLVLLGVPLASLHAGCRLPDVRPIDRIGSVRAPVLIVHSRHDPLIPCEHSIRLYEQAAQPKVLLLTDTAGHGSVLAGATDEYVRAATDLLKSRRPAQ
jgi:pimeloyl-ACP methyl ester carboxylesterase